MTVENLSLTYRIGIELESQLLTRITRVNELDIKEVLKILKRHNFLISPIDSTKEVRLKRRGKVYTEQFMLDKRFGKCTDAETLEYTLIGKHKPINTLSIGINNNDNKRDRQIPQVYWELGFGGESGVDLGEYIKNAPYEAKRVMKDFRNSLYDLYKIPVSCRPKISDSKLGKTVSCSSIQP